MRFAARHAAAAALCGYFALLILWVVWATLLAPLHHAPTALVLSAGTLPLLPWLRGLLYDRRSAYMWLGLISLGYFIHGIGAATDDGNRVPALLEVGFSLLLFGACLLRLKH